MNETQQPAVTGPVEWKLGVIGETMRETTFKILAQGDVQMAHCQGYMVAGGADAVCFYIDPIGRAYISASTESDSGCPVVYVSRDDCERDTEIELANSRDGDSTLAAPARRLRWRWCAVRLMTPNVRANWPSGAAQE